MNSKYKLAFLTFVPIGAVLLAGFFIRSRDAAIFNPQGVIASQQRDLIVFALLLSLVVVIPVFVLTFFIAWHYREGNHKAQYSPNWDHSRWPETIWWGIPLTLILILSIVTWRTSHELDPFKPLSSSTPPMTIQVVALDWKWLFIYPEQNVATVNYVPFPMDTPIDFNITSDAPMNSFWIPNLGGQIYAMSGMSTHLNLMADGAGSYRGVSANISGRGFADMSFKAKSLSYEDFDEWVQSVRQSRGNLSANEYNRLARPSQNNKPASYSSVEPELYNKILMKYMLPYNQLPKAERL